MSARRKVQKRTGWTKVVVSDADRNKFAPLLAEVVCPFDGAPSEIVGYFDRAGRWRRLLVWYGPGERMQLNLSADNRSYSQSFSISMRSDQKGGA